MTSSFVPTMAAPPDCNGAGTEDVARRRLVAGRTSIDKDDHVQNGNTHAPSDVITPPLSDAKLAETSKGCGRILTGKQEHCKTLLPRPLLFPY